MPIIPPRADRRPRLRLSDELRLDVLGHQALGLEWTAPAAHGTEDVLARIDRVLAEATR